MEIRYYNLVTDRTAENVVRLQSMAERGWENLTDADRLAWEGKQDLLVAGTPYETADGMDFCVAVEDDATKGAYNADDLNRVNRAMRYLNGRLEKDGYGSEYADLGLVWEEPDLPTSAQLEAYLQNVQSLQATIGMDAELPDSMAMLTYAGANAIEQCLVDMDDRLDRMEAAFFYSNEIFAGEVS